METERAIAWGTAVRWLRWAPLIAGVVALDRFDGGQALIAAPAIAIDVAVLCMLVSTALTKDVNLPRPRASWLEALCVWAAISTGLTAQATLSESNTTFARTATMLAAVAAGALLAELIESRRSLGGSTLANR
jgi:hypothetical protein